MIKHLILFQMIMFTLTSCGKYEMNSIYHISDESLPFLMTSPNAKTEGSFIKIESKVIESDPTKLLRYGHIWGFDSSLSFKDSYINFDENEYNKLQNESIEFDSNILVENRRKKLYIRSYAVNEIGLVYSNVQSVCSDLYLDRIIIIEEENNDNKINPGETVKLRFYFKNQSLIQSISPKVRTITKSSNFINSVTPFRNIDFSDTIVGLNNEAFVEATFDLASNANAFIEFQIFVIDECFPEGRDIKDINNNNLRININ